MRKKRSLESDEQRSDRLEKRSLDQRAQASAEDDAIDAAIRRSIKQLGP